MSFIFWYTETKKVINLFASSCYSLDPGAGDIPLGRRDFADSGSIPEDGVEILDRDVGPSGVLLLTRLPSWLSPPRVSLSWSSARLGEIGTRTVGLHKAHSEGSQDTVNDFLVATNPASLTCADSRWFKQ